MSTTRRGFIGWLCSLPLAASWLPRFGGEADVEVDRTLRFTITETEPVKPVYGVTIKATRGTVIVSSLEGGEPLEIQEGETVFVASGPEDPARFISSESGSGQARWITDEGEEVQEFVGWSPAGAGRGGECKGNE